MQPGRTEQVELKFPEFEVKGHLKAMLLVDNAVLGKEKRERDHRERLDNRMMEGQCSRLEADDMLE
jgi:hypothetical protein